MLEIKSAIRETLRTTVIAVLPLAIIQLEAGTLDWKVLAISFAIGFLRGVDKYLKETENPASKVLAFDMIK